jgi:PipA/GogA/GtgA family effector protease
MKHPDMQWQCDEPDEMRLAHDVKANDASARFTPQEIGDKLIKGQGRHDPDRPFASQDDYRETKKLLDKVLADAYEKSPTFRRLFNYAEQDGLEGKNWKLAPNETFGVTLPDKERGVQPLLALNRDPVKGTEFETYLTASGEHIFDAERSYIHEVVHVLTEWVDPPDPTRRGPVVEYENIILKEMGNESPARIQYGPGAESSSGKGIDDFDLGL